jgi:NAD(P)H-hydrate epimerase
MQRGLSVSVFLIGRVGDVRADARTNLEILGRLGVTVVEIADGQAWELHFSEVRECSLIVDAIFGTGLNAPVSGLIESVIADVNASGITVVSIDMPSGLSADAIEPIGESIEADTTVTLAAPKLPLILPPGETRAGDIVIAAACATSSRPACRTATKATTAACSSSPARAARPAPPTWRR